MQSTADARQRPIVLDTGELRPAVGRRGRLARAVLEVAVVVLLGAGAIAAGGWSIMTAVRGNAPAEQPAPLWYPTPEPVHDAEVAPSTTPSPAAPPARTVTRGAGSSREHEIADG